MLKKAIVLLVALFSLCFFGLKNAIPIFTNYADNFEVYTESACSNAVIVSTSKQAYPFILNKYGESCKIQGEFDLQSFLADMGAKAVFIEKTESGESYYAYSSDIRYAKTVKNKRVNLQIHIGDCGVTVGSPIIFGSF